MYLIHITPVEYLKKILLDNSLKSNKLTGNINLGLGVYNGQPNSFVYFSTTDKLFDPNILVGSSECIIYLNADILFNKSFYVSHYYSANPITKKKYSRYTKNYNSILKKLYNYSINQLENSKVFYIFQQIAIKNKISINKYLAGIEIKYSVGKTIDDSNKELLFYINKNYSDIPTAYTPFQF